MSRSSIVFCWLLPLLIISGCKRDVYERTEFHHGKEINRLAAEFNLPATYLKALIVLESSGHKKVPSRFERQVYQQLVKLRDGKLRKYENLRPHHLKDASDAALRNLASSWGPFQLMGYKCLSLGIYVSDLRGEKALYWGVYWINKDYGTYLRQKRFEEAFRMHNTGSPKGKTYHPDYVANGIRHMQHFGAAE